LNEIQRSFFTEKLYSCKKALNRIIISHNEAPCSPAFAGRDILNGIAPKLALPFYRVEAVGEGRCSMQQAAEHRGEGE
jgi:hypothetical protein